MEGRWEQKDGVDLFGSWEPEGSRAGRQEENHRSEDAVTAQGTLN